MKKNKKLFRWDYYRGDGKNYRLIMTRGIDLKSPINDDNFKKFSYHLTTSYSFFE